LLFATAKTRRASAGPLNPGRLTVLDYGIPDFSACSAASVTDQRLLAEMVRAAIAAFEPRLAHVQVQLHPEVERPRMFAGLISARLRIDTVMEQVSFPVLLHTADGEVEVISLPENSEARLENG
jgi:type VI secretion system lysozyme-like protein